MQPKHNGITRQGHEPPEKDPVLTALRANISLLRELSARYGVEHQPDRPVFQPAPYRTVRSAHLLGPEMSPLAQEQLRVLLLNVRNQMVGQRVIYIGNVSSIMFRPAEVLRPAVLEAAPRIIVVHNHPTGAPRSA